ncbi:mercuric reductase [Variovorax sp. PAMC 28711]|uniref:mercuric reductase n=1 Tax=Variovorax sp. PAMC 28711 TaxID=1795631 RepID=UPI00078C4C59|nr:mercuric reductase [Variovorax sp. PAMC 28711]AMM23546.1 mercuric reductase [Variovorax sp. PAMC 28711]
MSAFSQAAEPADARLANTRPAGWRSPKPLPRYDLLIIGAGPAGLAAARAAAALGAHVALVERHELGGNSLSDGCIPSKSLIRTARLLADMRNAENFGVASPAEVAFDFAAAMRRMRRVTARISRRDSAMNLARAGIHLFFGVARFTGPDAVEVDGVPLHFKKALIATGSRSLLPDIPGLDEAGYLTNETVFDLDVLPPSLMVIGGGPLGCELAQVFARFGSRTLISHSEPLFLPQEERDAAQMVSDALARDGVEIHLNSTVTRVRMEDGRKVVDLMNDGSTATTRVDTLLTGIGRVPAVQGLGLESAGVAYDAEGGIHVDDFLRTSNRRIFAAGDVCLTHKFTNTAEASARIVVRNALLLGHERMSALTVPWCTYTDPEVAHVGLYVREARQQRIPVKTFTIPMHDVDRAIADGEEDGFVKIHVREGTDTILGATIVARHAGEMINSISLAMVTGIGLQALSRVIHAYPTQGAAIRQAADAYARTAMTPRLLGRVRLWWQR